MSGLPGVLWYNNLINAIKSVLVFICLLLPFLFCYANFHSWTSAPIQHFLLAKTVLSKVTFSHQCSPVTWQCPLGVFSDPCINGGACMDKVGRFSCKCRPGFYGERCEMEVNECESSPCRHGGTCTDYVNSYTCQCPPGFNGINCERNIPECTET